MRGKVWGLFWLGLVLALAAGCSGQSGGPKKDDKKEDKKGGEPDEGKPPHGGALFAPKGQHTYHLELTKEMGKPAHLYVLDGKVKKYVPITAKTIEMEVKGDKPLKIEFKAEPQEGETKDASSRFTAPAGKVPDNLDLSKVEIHAEIKDKQYHFTEDKD